MKLLEYEAKAILGTYAISMPGSTIVTKNTSVLPSIPTVLKSQVPVGGRGKLGGVVIVDSSDELKTSIDNLFSLEIKGYLPKVLLAEEKLSIQREHYLCLLIDRESATIRLIAHKDGGVEVEGNNSSDFLNIEINEMAIADCAKNLSIYLGYDESIIEPLLTNLHMAFIKNDITLLEINPLIYTANNQLVCGDCKMELDDMAAFRHPEWKFEDMPASANFVTLNTHGTVATIANGAGLAMATVDAVAARGMAPANFLDIGGGATTETILKAFTQLAAFPNIKAIVINIFAGITRCDEVARAIIEAQKQITHLPPLFIRLAGTNFEEAVTLLQSEDITTLASLEECLDAAKEATNA